MNPFVRDQMMAEAERDTGLLDWGDPDFLEPLGILIESLNSEADLSVRGVVRTRIRLENLLRQRLRIYADRKANPAIAAQVVRDPLVMTGMPRAGTSFLNSLLAQDAANASPRGWQMLCPSPPPNDTTYDHRAQIAAATVQLNDSGFTDTELRSRHEYGALNAEEDGWLNEFQFLSNNFTAFWNVPSYSGYLASHSYAPAYRMHHRLLQALQVGSEGRRWTLKAPEHVLNLPLFIERYPDAGFIIHHRDPSKVIASVLSLLGAHRAQFSERPLLANRAFVSAFLDQLAGAMERMIEYRRDKALDRRFADIQYVELERRPLETVHGIYEHFGLRLTDHAVSEMDRWLRSNRKGKHGRHIYSLGDYGFTAAEIHERFAAYIRHFDIEIEPSGQ